MTKNYHMAVIVWDPQKTFPAKSCHSMTRFCRSRGAGRVTE